MAAVRAASLAAEQQTAMPAVPTALAWQLYQQTATPAVQADLPWQLYQHDCHDSCAGRTLIGQGSCTSKTAILAVPAGLSWQLYQQD